MVGNTGLTASIIFDDEKHNSNDYFLIYLCSKSPQSISQLAKALNIASKNVIVRLPKLEEEGIIKIERLGKGKKTLVMANKEHPDFQGIIQRWEMKQLFDSAFLNLSDKDKLETIKMIKDNSEKILGRQVIKKAEDLKK